jgi:CheY-like chemotaxis protein
MPQAPVLPLSPRVVFLGFSAFEHSALSSAFRLNTHRSPRYEVVPGVAAAHFLVANSDHASTVQAVLAAGRLEQTVFIGNQAPTGGAVWMRRPIDPLHVMRELDALAAVQLAAPVAHVPAAPIATPPAAALLVDDSDIALRFLQKRLAPFALHGDCASGSAKAIDLLAKVAYRFVFIDVELGPGSTMDGLALCQHIKRQHRPVGAVQPLVVMVSAHQSELDRARGSLAGCDAYLGKPLHPPELHRLMRRHGVTARPAALRRP